MADKGGYIGRSPGDSAVIIARQNYSPTGIQTDFTFNSSYTPGYVDVYLNGVRLIDVQDYTASTGNTVGLTSYANSGDIVEVIAYKAFNVGNVTNATGNFDVGGNLNVNTDLNVSGLTTTKNLNVTGVSTLTGASYLADVTELVSSGIVTVSNTTDSTSSTTGALQVRGGVGVALSMTVGGSLSVGGTITYEDVTNVDAIGIITARSGVNIVGGGLTATGVGTFFGDVQVNGGSVHLDASGELAVFETDTNLAFTNSAKLALDFSSNIARIRTSVNGSASVRPLAIYTGNDERLRITTAGNVGINQDTPTAPLHVKGTGNDTVLLVESTDADANVGPIIELFRNSASPADGDVLGRLDFKGEDDAGNASTFARILVTALDVSNNSEDARLDFVAATNDTFNPTMSITGEKVGIGSTIPTKSIDIFTDTSGDGVRMRSVGNTYNEIYFGANRTSAATHLGRVIGYWNDTAVTYISLDTGSDTTNKDDGQIRFWTSEASGSCQERLRIARDGLTSLPLGGVLSIGNQDGRDIDWVHALQVEGTTAANSSISIMRNSNDVNPPYLTFCKSRGTAVGAETIVAENDLIANIQFKAADGNAGEANAAGITVEIDATPGDQDVPARMVFKTTPDGSASAVERLRINNQGEIIAGASGNSARAISVPGYTTARIVQAEIKGPIDTSGGRHYGSLALNCTDENAALHLIRSQANNSSGLDAGLIGFTVFDGTDYHQCARIMASRDAAGGDGDTPGRLTFHTTADGASSATERVRIDSVGNMGLGVTPNANWPTNGDFRALQVGTGIAVFGRGSGDEDRGGIAANYYHTGSASKFIGNGHAGRMYFEDGGIVFSNTATANANGANEDCSLSERLRITPEGNLALGSATNKGDIHSSYRSLQVYNSAYVWGYTSASYPAVHITNNARPTTSSFTSGWKRDLAGTYTAPVQVELYHGDFNVRTADNDSADTAISWDTRFSIKQAGDVQVKTGNLVIGTAGKGIDFSATGNSNHVTDDEVLEDYERGTWNPGFTFGGNNANWGWNSEGHYEKIGNVVTCIGQLDFTAKNSGYSTGAANITGLPYTVADIMANTSQEGAGWFTYFANMGTSSYSYYDFWVAGGTTTCSIQRHSPATSVSTASAADFNSNSQLRFWISYFTG